MAPEVSPETLKPQKLDLRAPPKGSTCTVVGIIPQRGEWLAAYAVMRAGKNESSPTIVDVCPISDLPEQQQKKARNWMSAFARFVEAASPAGTPLN